MLQQFKMRCFFGTLLCLAAATISPYRPAIADEPSSTPNSAPPVRCYIPRAKTPPILDGQLQSDEYRQAVCTPIEYFHRDVKNRAGQFYYLWDEEAFYVGLRTLDETTYSPAAPLWEGDAVEWYFDTRRGPDFLSRTWPGGPHSGAIHCFFTPMDQAELKPRFTVRPGFADAIPQTGVEVAARRTDYGLEVEFKLPWVNFPDFRPAAGEVIGIDAELSYSDGGPRSYRSFVFGNPLSVQQPANLARVELVDRWERRHWRAAGAVMMPIRVDLPWSQPNQPHVVAQIASPPGRTELVGKVVFQLTDLRGMPIAEFVTQQETAFEPAGDFARREAHWPASVAAPGTYQVQAIVYDPAGTELTRVAPRLVSVNMQPGY